MANLFTTLLEKVSSKMSKEEALYTILSIAMTIDGEQDERERAMLDNVFRGSKTLMGINGADSVIRSADSRLAGAKTVGDLNEIAGQACDVLLSMGEEISKSAFTLALDIMLADSILHENEKRLIGILAEKLAIEDDFVGMAIDVLAAKNKY